jgi:hypothetical protein
VRIQRLRGEGERMVSWAEVSRIIVPLVCSNRARA